MVKFKQYISEGPKLDTELMNASLLGELELVKKLISKGADIHTHNNYSLRWASRNGHLEVVKYLIEKKADIHALDNNALMLANENNQIEVVKYLISKMDPKYVIDKLPEFTKYIVNPKYTHASFAGKYGMFKDN